jgi:LysM repeat protein
MKRILSVLLALGLFGVVLAPAASAATCSTNYTVVPGDNLFRIGVKFGVPWPQIATANNLTDPGLIFPGQVLCIPAGSGTPAPTATGPTATPANTSTPAPTSAATATSQPAPTAVPTVVATPGTSIIPTFSISSVVQNTSVTIVTANFPANQDFVVSMGPLSNQGLGGATVATTNSGAGGVLTATYTIPASLAGVPQISIRMQSAAGYYSFNWFWNATAP